MIVTSTLRRIFSILLLAAVSIPVARAQYCLPSFGIGCTDGDAINSFVVSGERGSAIHDTASHCTAGAYRNASSSMQIDFAQGNTYTAFISSEFVDESVEIFIDYNDDSSFSAGESVGGENHIDSLGLSFNFSISPNAPAGTHRMRVVMSFDYTYPGIDACPDSNAGYYYGEVHDYAVTILPGSNGPCDPVAELRLKNITDTGAYVFWDAVPGAIGYEYVAGTSSSVPSAGGTFVSGASAQVRGLTAGGANFIHVRSKCGPTTFSSWTTQPILTNASARDWVYLRPDNTGLGGDYNAVVTGDYFGNIWLGGYMPSEGQGSVVRLEGNGVFTNWGTYDGFIPNGQVESIAFEKNGSLWVGSTAGISKFDNVSWTNYDTSNSPLRIAGVRGLAVDASNNVWASTYRQQWGYLSQLVHFNGSTWVLDTAGQPTENLYRIAIDSAGTKWIGSDIGLIKYNGATWTVYNNSNSGLSGAGTSVGVQVDSINQIWCSSGGSIDIFNGSSWNHINTFPDSNFIADYFYVRGGSLMVADYNKWEILIRSGSGWLSHRAPGWISDLYIDTNGHYWVTGQGFLSKFDGSTWHDYNRYNSGLSEYFNNDVFVDSKNRKWFANGNGGIQVFDCPKWEAYGPLNGGMYPSPQVMTTIGTSVTEDSEGDIWMTYDGTYGYAVQIPKGDYRNYSAWKYWNDTAVGLPGFQSVQKVVASTDGKVAMLTFWGEIFMFDHATNGWTSYKYGSGLNVNPQGIAAGLDGKLYAMGYGSMDEFSNGSWSNIDLSAQGITAVHDLAFDSSKNLWLASSEGVWKYDSSASTWTTWNDTNSALAANFSRCIEIDNKSGTVYVGAYNTSTWPYYGGLSVFDGTTWVNFLQGSSSLPHKQLEDISLDTLGNAWLLPQSTGVTVFRKGGVQGFGCINRNIQLRQIQNPSSVGGTHSELDVAVYPNPVSATAVLEFGLTAATDLRAVLYDVQGRAVRTLYSGRAEAGRQRVSWSREGLSAGVYFVRVSSPAFRGQQRIVIR